MDLITHLSPGGADDFYTRGPCMERDACIRDQFNDGATLIFLMVTPRDQRKT